jgi:hypothetical protein
MPWFIYNFPGGVHDPNSYSLITSKPSCIGNTLCGIYAQSTGTIPNRPVITDEINAAINQALNGEITEDVTVLRPSPPYD